MRPRLLVLLLPLLLPSVGATHEEPVRIINLAFFSHEFVADANSTWALRVDVEGPPVDVLLFNASEFQKYLRNESFELLAPPTAFHVVQYDATFRVPASGDWVLVVDNTFQPTGGASPQGEVVVQIDLRAYTPPSTGALTFWEALTLQRDAWYITEHLAVAGLTIWMTLLAVLCWPRDARVLVWTGAVAVTLFLDATITEGNVAVNIVVPVLLGVLVGLGISRLQPDHPWRGVKGVYFATFLGVLVGADLLTLAFEAPPSRAGEAWIVGGARFGDALLLAPLAAVGAFLVVHRTLMDPDVEAESGAGRSWRSRLADDWPDALLGLVLLVVFIAVVRRLLLA